MGSQSVKEISNLKERQEYLSHLLGDIEALELMIKQDAFEKGKVRIGAEQELCIVDEFFRPSYNALEILKKINDHHFTTELALFNLEINLDPVLLNGNCFSMLEEQLLKFIEIAEAGAKEVELNKILLTGILPTLKKKDLVFKNITPFDRYKTLNRILKKIRGNDFKLHIRGVDELIVTHESILFEACNTSFQIHLQVDLDDLVDKYNWSQAIAGPVLASMTNSPLLLGRELWSETRIALFQQSIDLRNESYHLREQKARVSFGTEWLKDSPIELFKDDISRYASILTTDFNEDSIEVLKKGEIPKLTALNIFNGTLYKWNRLCYGITEGLPHLRIENRYIPSGPSIKDEVANAVFWIGLMQGMPKKYSKIHDLMPFNDARGNFINAARTGINTYFNWFGKGISAKKLVLKQLIPIAKEGLKKSNISSRDAKYYLKIIKERVETSHTGSIWITKSNRLLRKSLTRDISNATLTSCMIENQKMRLPGHKWKLASANDCVSINLKDNKLEKMMSTELFVVNEFGLVFLVNKVMDWKNIHHIPVVDGDNKMVGLITRKDMRKIDLENNRLLVANEIMIKDVISVNPSITIEKAKQIMYENKIGCLPVVKNEVLVGILTKNDLKKIYKSTLNDEKEV